MDYREGERGDWLGEYVSGQLSPELQADFELHILECSQQENPAVFASRGEFAGEAVMKKSWGRKIQKMARVVGTATIAVSLLAISGVVASAQKKDKVHLPDETQPGDPL